MMYNCNKCVYRGQKCSDGLRKKRSRHIAVKHLFGDLKGWVERGAQNPFLYRKDILPDQIFWIFLNQKVPVVSFFLIPRARLVSICLCTFFCLFLCLSHTHNCLSAPQNRNYNLSSGRRTYIAIMNEHAHVQY